MRVNLENCHYTQYTFKTQAQYLNSISKQKTSEHLSFWIICVTFQSDRHEAMDNNFEGKNLFEPFALKALQH